MSAIVAALLLAAPVQAIPRPPVCNLPAGWSSVAAARHRYVVFGEKHGTREAPAFFGEVACALAARGRRVLVAIEHDSRFDAAIRAAWRLSPARFGTALHAAGWAGCADGRASEAMLAMLVRLHAAKARGRAIDIVAFSGVRDAAQRDRLGPLSESALYEAAQADNIRIAAEAERYDDVLVLVGNMHARRAQVERGDASYEPMAMWLARAGSVLALNGKAAGGAGWSCLMRRGFVVAPGKPMPKDAVDCGPHPVLADEPSGPPGSISLDPAAKGEADAAYDGVFHLGTVTASPPAVPVRSAP